MTETVDLDDEGSAEDATPAAPRPAARDRAASIWTWLTGDEGPPRRSTIAAWAVLAVVWLVIVISVVRWDFRDVPRTGDENNWILQSLSLAYEGHNLTFDARDIARWEQLDWRFTPRPQGIFFRTDGHGYSVGKPYGYSAWLAPFVRVFGAPTGIAIGNAVLLTLLLTVALAILRTRMRGPGVPLLAGAFVFGSYVYFYAFTTAVDLFLAAVTAIGTLALLRAWTHRNAWWAALGAGATAVALGDRITVGFALIPALVVVLVRLGNWRNRLIVVALTVIAYFVVVAPYLYYSDGRAFSPYAQPRHYSSASPFDTPVEDYVAAHPETKPNPNAKPDNFTPEGVWHRLTDDPEQIPRTAFYSVFGRHTGLLPFLPIGFFVGILTLVYWRKVDAIGWGFAAGLVGYVLLYVVLYSDNFYGGAHSLGNRYLLQVAPLFLGVAATLQLSTRVAVAAALIAGALSLVFLWPHHASREWAYLHMERTTAVQRLLPFEGNQRHAEVFICPRAFGYVLPCAR